MTEGQSLMGSAFLFPAPPDSPKALNSGGSEAVPPRDNPRLISQAAVMSLFIAMAPPGFDLFLSILQAQKPMPFQTFLPKAALA